jgi:pimeloyl-ACP methyl ester carboxylesterase
MVILMRPIGSLSWNHWASIRTSPNASAQSEQNRIDDTLVESGRLLIVIDEQVGQAFASGRPWPDSLSDSIQLVDFAWNGTPAVAFLNGASAVISQVDALRSSLGYSTMTLLGVALGGMVALAYAVDYPYRLDGLILCNAGPLPEGIDVGTAEASSGLVNADNLAMVATPTLILAGQRDGARDAAETAERLHALLSDSTLVLFDHSGQYPYHDEPDRFTAIVADWLCQQRFGKISGKC